MSLIHDALKKAQEEAKAQVGSGLASFQEPPAKEKQPINKRTAILAGVLIIALILLVYSKFSGTKKNVAQTSATPATAVNPLSIGGATDSKSLKKKAMDAYNAGDLDAAFATLTAAADFDNKDPEIWNNLGLVARKQGDVANARLDYQKALDLKADYPEAMNNMAVLEMQSGNNAEAKLLLEKAVKLTPAYPEANLHLAILYDQNGETQKAIEFYKRFLEVGKNFPSAVVDSVRDRVMEIEP